MKKLVSNLDHWPRTKGGDLIIEDSHEAAYLGHLVAYKPDVIKRLLKQRKDIYDRLERLRKGTSINYQYLFNLAVKGQLCREAVEEVARVRGKYPVTSDFEHFELKEVFRNEDKV